MELTARRGFLSLGCYGAIRCSSWTGHVNEFLNLFCATKNKQLYQCLFHKSQQNNELHASMQIQNSQTHKQALELARKSVTHSVVLNGQHNLTATTS